MDSGLQRYSQFLEKVRLTRKRILVVGDRIADRYVECLLTRIAPEGGAPVLEVERSYCVPGGAANVAEQLLAWNVVPHGLYGMAEHSKTRHLANGVLHSVVSRNGAPAPIRQENLVLEAGVDAIVVADYGKGAITVDIAMRICDMARNAGIPLIVDPSPSPESDADRRWTGASVIKMNRDQWRRRGAIARDWMEALRLDSMVITNGATQPFVYSSPPVADILPVRPIHKPIVDCAGAGDHFLAVLTVGLVHGLTVSEASEFAHESSRLRVAYRRPRPIVPAEVRGAFDTPLGKILSAEDVSKVVSPNDQIVFTNGVFSIVHAGHASLFDFAKRHGDTLVVGVNSDSSAASIRETRGKTVIMPAEQRARIVASHQAVDYVILFDDMTPESTMEKLPPIDTLVKGIEYQGKEIPGCNLARRTLFAPHLFTEHCSDWFSRAPQSEN